MNESNDPAADEANPFAQSGVGGGQVQQADSLRPTGVTVTGVVCIMAGILGILMTLIVGLQLAAGNRFASAMAPPGQAGDVQREFYAQLQTVNDKFFIPNIGVVVGLLILSCCMVAGGVYLFQRVRSAPIFVRRVLLAGIIFELIRQAFYFLVQSQMFPVMSEFMQKMADTSAGPGVPPGTTEMMHSVQKMSMYVGLAFAAIWALIKIGLMVWGRSYLKRQHVVSYFQNSSPGSSEAT